MDLSFFFRPISIDVKERINGLLLNLKDEKFNCLRHHVEKARELDESLANVLLDKYEETFTSLCVLYNKHKKYPNLFLTFTSETSTIEEINMRITRIDDTGSFLQFINILNRLKKKIKGLEYAKQIYTELDNMKPTVKNFKQSLDLFDELTVYFNKLTLIINKKGMLSNMLLQDTKSLNKLCVINSFLKTQNLKKPREGIIVMLKLLK